MTYYREAKNSLEKPFKRPQLRLNGIYFTLGKVLQIGPKLKGQTPEVQTEVKIKSQTLFEKEHMKRIFK